MVSSVDPGELLAVQRALRDRIFRGKLTGEGRRQRALAAEMLLYLDEPQSCWQAAARGLMSAIAADRIDAGFATARDSCYRPTFEYIRAEAGLPSVLGAAMDARDPGIVAVWQAPHVVAFDDVRSDRRLGADLRAALIAAGTRRKLAVALRDDQRGDVGLLCVDASTGVGWHAEERAHLDSVVRNVIAPILSAARGLARDAEAAHDGGGESPGDDRCAVLTPAELRVARLVLTGCSYKEIARQLGRSASTVDHHLRSMRDKLGVNSTAKLMRNLIGHLPTLVAAATPTPTARSDRRH